MSCCFCLCTTTRRRFFVVGPMQKLHCSLPISAFPSLPRIPSIHSHLGGQGDLRCLLALLGRQGLHATNKTRGSSKAGLSGVTASVCSCTLATCGNFGNEVARLGMVCCAVITITCPHVSVLTQLMQLFVMRCVPHLGCPVHPHSRGHQQRQAALFVDASKAGQGRAGQQTRVYQQPPCPCACVFVHLPGTADCGVLQLNNC
jgi:hypothetical protein